MTAKKLGGRFMYFLVGVCSLLGVLGALWAFAWNDVQPQGQKIEYLGVTMLLVGFLLGYVALQTFPRAFKR